MNGFQVKPPAVASTWTRIIPLLLFSFSVVAPVIAAVPNTLESDVSTNPTATGDWVQQGFDVAHTKFNRFETELTRDNVGSLVELWTSEDIGGGTLDTTPVVADGKVFIGGFTNSSLYALDAETGETLWVGPKQDLLFTNSAAVSHGLVFASALFSPLSAYDADTGEIVWTAAGTDLRASPTLRGRTLYVGNTDGTLDALEAATGNGQVVG